MIVAIDQPNYLPWKGYFDLIHDVDLFVFYNDVQYTVRDWRSRNKIITPDGEKWISVPAGNNRNRLICEVKLNDSSWQIKHLKTIKFAYSKSPFYKKYIDFFEHVYLEKNWQFLFELDQYLTVNIAKEFLGIKTRFVDSRNYPKYGAKHDKLMSLLTSICTDSVGGGMIYISLALQQKITLNKKILNKKKSSLLGKITKDILNTSRILIIFLTKFQSSIYFLMLEKKLLISFGDGERTQVLKRTSRISNSVHSLKKEWI